MLRRSTSILMCFLLSLGASASLLLLGGTAAQAAPMPTWYLAEGSTAWGFTTYINIQNPNPTGVDIAVTYMTPTGPEFQPPFIMPANSKVTINPLPFLGQKDFSTRVVCTDPTKTIAVDRQMSWMGGPGSEIEKNMETHSSVGVTSASNVWFLPEGSSKWGFETWLVVQNPTGADAPCEFTYMIEDYGPFTVHKTVPANSRRSFDMKDDIGSADASVRVSSPQQIIAERAMYRDSRRMGHNSIGATAPSFDFFLAEGSTAWGYTTYLVVQNPGVNVNQVTVTYMKTGSSVTMPPFNMNPGTRETIRVNDVQPDADLSIKVSGSSPLLAERAMYWGNTLWGEVGHDSIGVSGPHPVWYLPGGNTQPLFETWTCVQNPNPVDVNIEITYYPEGFTSEVQGLFTVSANTRRTFNMADAGMSEGRYATRVRSLTPGQDIICERATYIWTMAGSLSMRTSGESTIGAWQD